MSDNSLAARASASWIGQCVFKGGRVSLRRQDAIVVAGPNQRNAAATPEDLTSTSRVVGDPETMSQVVKHPLTLTDPGRLPRPILK